MQIDRTEIPGVFCIRPFVHHDQRGVFCKLWRRDEFLRLGLNGDWREAFYSTSCAGVIRGLHFQVPPADHAKLIACCRGRIWDVVVDLRRGSPTYGQHVARELSDDNRCMFYIPRGCAHGFLALTNDALVMYGVETEHAPTHDQGIRWDSCGIQWPLTAEPIVSPRDRSFVALADFDSPFIYEP
ncbi:MAG: dTDP-4-dehydrorhamnose 3,5-epimerase [Planctomycetota bacterium]|nr:dTDP-4-dehydrorhamnose 3,5-epimerase [Planctomycetota bacterium]MCX8040086.1 dTDP-4-dehydrorhamnose 3,5-epimerase [Planctomycetota bacterium]